MQLGGGSVRKEALTMGGIELDSHTKASATLDEIRLLLKPERSITLLSC